MSLAHIASCPLGGGTEHVLCTQVPSQLDTWQPGLLPGGADLGVSDQLPHVCQAQPQPHCLASPATSRSHQLHLPHASCQLPGVEGAYHAACTLSLSSTVQPVGHGRLKVPAPPLFTAQPDSVLGAGCAGSCAWSAACCSSLWSSTWCPPSPTACTPSSRRAAGSCTSSHSVLAASWLEGLLKQVPAFLCWMPLLVC